MKVSRTTYQDWPPTLILLISASQVAKITGMLLAKKSFY
jgi:hypothetical protein